MSWIENAIRDANKSRIQKNEKSEILAKENFENVLKEVKDKIQGDLKYGAREGNISYTTKYMEKYVSSVTYSEKMCELLVNHPDFLLNGRSIINCSADNRGFKISFDAR